ncbi:SpaH/EbpB family LPXTG-anchored major pilin [Agathobacter rectalis]|uniref:SpaH/EbpB family LPXTG-anchored major pilin n=1 Tax=Agathobacter rectalis TaxID=39491 RepID=UPI003ED90F72
MKKFKKMLAGLLGAAMVLTSFGTPAWADSATRPNLPTIDTNQKGTLTINKYEGTDENTSKDKPLAGVEFTIWKVADIEQDTSPSSNVGFKFVPVSTLTSLTADDFKSDKTKADEYTSDIYNKVLKKLNASKEVENGTLANGIKKSTVIDETGKASAKFTDLDLGLYLVQETKAPSQIVNKTANFLVSVPMTNENGTAWNYDVVAEPKNAAVYAGINLIKRGTTIKADGTPETVNLAGVKFVLQSRPTGSDDSVTWTKVGSYTTESNGTINVNDLAPNDYRFIETGLGENNGYILNGKPYKFTVQNDGKIKVGFEKPTDIATITADNEKPDLKKEVKKGDTYANAADASIGDMVEWKVSASVPSNVDQLEKYSITDKMSDALTWVEDESALNITYKSNGTVVNDIDPKFAETADYTLIKPADKEDGKSWTITFTDAGKKKLKDNNISSIEVTFKTKLNKKANIGSEGNLNDAQLDYSNAIYPLVDPTNPNDGKKPGEDHIKDQAIVYSFSIDVTKVDGNNTTTKLEGVHFDLYKYSGTVTNPTESDLKGTYGTKINAADLKTDGNGKITVNGLENGDYYLVETQAAAGGYNLLKAPVKVLIAQKYSVKKETTVTKDKDGNVTSTTTVVNETFKGGASDSGTYSVTIENRKGFTLPKTGDIGTAMFLIIGIGGMLAAVYIMLRGRKRA